MKAILIKRKIYQSPAKTHQSPDKSKKMLFYMYGVIFLTILFYEDERQYLLKLNDMPLNVIRFSRLRDLIMQTYMICINLCICII